MVTKSHKKSQEGLDLSIQQLNAIDLLVQGKTDQETSDTIGVARETVTRWRNENPYFLAELNRQRKAIWQSAHERLRSLLGKAIDTLNKALEKNDVKAAVEVLKAVKIYGEVGPPEGHDDPEYLLKAVAEDLSEKELRKQGYKPDLEEIFLDPFEKRKRNLAAQKLLELRKTNQK